MLLMAGVCAAQSGCVERTMRIQTNPPGALISVNDEEVGPSPAKFTFLWYGKYEIVARKEGFQATRVTYETPMPWYQIPPMDTFSESFVAGTIHDDHNVPMIELAPAESPTVGELVDRAVELRQRSQKTGQ